MDNLPILEMDVSQRPSDLRAQLDAVDRRKLAEQAYPRVDVAYERVAHSRWRRRRCGRGILTDFAMGETDPEECGERYHRRAHHPGPGRGPRGAGTPWPRVRPILKSPFAVFVDTTTCDPCVNRHFRPAHILRGLGKNVNAAELVEKLVPHRSRYLL